MRKLLLATLLLSCSVSHATLDLMQSSSDLNWLSISNDSVQVIYPDYLQGESVYIANLVEHYSQFVGKTYGINKPKQFSLIIRAEAGQPNGFVTLAPRRSEWFSSSSYTPAVGSAEWYQALSIHEYRHVNQFDHFNQQTTRILYYVMGDFGEQLAAFMALPAWYLEGDAVWTETKYTDAGRGRSPRFLARLKAMVLSNKIPTYDQLLNGTYTTDTPNHYVFGYALISYATQKYGADVWGRVTQDVAAFPLPLRFYTSFRHVTGQYFEDFYYETVKDLREKWGKDAPADDEIAIDYREKLNPAKIGDALYYVHTDLDTLPAIMKERNGKTEKIAELPYINEFQNMYFGSTMAVGTEYLPSPRFLFRNYSDLVTYDLKTGEKNKITSGERLYNPRMNAAQTKIIVTDFRSDNAWNLSEYNLQGELIQTFAIPGKKVEEAVYLDDHTAAVLLTSKTGLRSIAVVDLKSHTVMKTLLPESRNLIYGLNADHTGNILFEGQYKGHNEIFRINHAGTFRCTEARIGAYLPYSDGSDVYYSDVDTFGYHIASKKLNECGSLPGTQLVNFNYLGDNPSDNYNNFPPQPFPEQESLFTRNADKYKPESYGDFDKRLFVPHTWGLLIGRGFGLGAKTDNYLRTMGFTALVGSDPEEGQGFADLTFDFKKYYPIFQLQLEGRNRKVEDFDTSDKTQWTEKTAGLGMIVPYIRKAGVYNFTAAAVGSAAYTDTSDYKFNDTKTDFANYFYKTSAGAQFAWYKDGAYRSITAPWLLSYQIQYDNAESPSDSRYSSYRVYQEGVLQTPGLLKHDGLKFVYDHQIQDDSKTAYRFLPVNASVMGNVFSRGYDYEDVPEYQKYSGNYTFPIMYPDLNLGGWYYLKRMYGNVFFDSTVINETTKVDSTLNSYGGEVLFESTILRFLPLTIGARLLERLSDNQGRFGFFVATSLLY